MSRPLRLGVSSLGGAVYAGRLLKGGNVWATGKQDVTEDFLNCVVEKFGPKAGMTESVHSLLDSEGVEMFEIVVRKPVKKL